MRNSGPTVQTIVLQPTPFCNINCKYCYLPQRNDTSVMTLNTVMASLRRVFESTFAGEHITIIWHAGEPLVLPVSYYREAFQAIETIRPRSVRIQHSFQTNGTLINREWCALFREWKVGVGVSIDGPRELHDANRVTRAGKGTFDLAIRGIRLLREEDVPFHTISVLSRSSLESAAELHSFFLAEGIEDVCFNVEESEGGHVSELMTFSQESMSVRFKEFLQRFWTLSRSTPGIRYIREIDGVISRVFRPEEAHIVNDQVEPLAMLNIDCHGNVSSFSPELLGYKSERYNNFIIGNVHEHTLLQMLESPAMKSMAADIEAGVDACRTECGYFSVCGGGAPVNKLSENGSFSSTRTSFCNLIQITPSNVVLDALTRMEADFPPSSAPSPSFDPARSAGSCIPMSCA